MKWLSTIVRIVGAGFPVASSLVQLQSELDSNEISERITKLEDPISYLHNDVPKLSKFLFAEMKSMNTQYLHFQDEFYKKFSRPLAALYSQNYITCQHRLGSCVPCGVILSNPTFIMYLCALHEDQQKMDLLVNRLEECIQGISLNGKEIAQELEVPIPVVGAIFEIYEAKGYGKRSKTVSRLDYKCTA